MNSLPEVSINDSEVQECYHSFSENLQRLGSELSAQQRKNEYLLATYRAMRDSELHIQRHYFDTLQEVMTLQAAIANADRKLSYIDQRIGQFGRIDDLVICPDGMSYSRSTLEDTNNNGSGDTPTEQDYLPNYTLIMMLEKLSNLFPPHDRSNPYTTPAGFGNDTYDAHLNPGPQRMPRRSNVVTNHPYDSCIINSTNDSSFDMQGNTELSGATPTDAPQPEKLHPCLRVYGTCNYGKSCAYANYPYDACLSNLKGRCRFGLQCHERHVDLM